MTTSGEQYILRMIVDVKNDVALKDLTNNIKGAGTAMSTSNRQMQSGSRTTKQLGYAFQSAGYQATDFFVQVQGGVSATRALSQQLPQLLAGFNIVNPVFAASTAILATFTALLPAIVSQFKATGDEMRSLDQIATDFAKAIDNATGDVVQDSLRGYDEAIQSATGATRRLLEVQKSFAQQDFASALERDGAAVRALISSLSPDSLAAGRGVGTFASPFGGQADLTAGRSREQIIAENIEAANLDIARSYQFLADQLKRDEITLSDFLDTLNALAGEGLVGGAQIREIISSGSGFITGEEQQTLSEFVDDIIRLTSVTGTTQAQAGINWDSYLPSSAQVETLDDFLNSIIGLTTGPNLTQAQAGANFEAYLPGGGESDPAFEKQRDALIAQAEAYQNSLLPAVERYSLELEELNKQIEMYNLSEEQASALTDKITEKYRSQADAVREVAYEMSVSQEFVLNAFKSFDRNFQSFVNGIASGTADMQDLFKRMAASIIADLTRIYLTQLLTGLVFGNGGTQGSTAGIPTSLDPSAFAKGGVLANGVQMFAKGGVVSSPTMFPMSRGVGMMGEAGAEGIFPLGRMTNGELGVKGAPMNVVINNNAGVEVSASQGSEGLTIDIVRAVVASDISRGGSAISSAVAGSFGLQRAGV